MYGAGPGSEELRRLREEVARLQRERGEAVGMVQILQGKLHEVEADKFDLQANMATIEAEIQYESKKASEVMQKHVTSLESKLSFLNEQLKNADRVKLRALRELEELQQKQMLEQKRLDAEKRLLATKKRKHESAVMAASQTIMTRMSQLEKAPSSVSPPSRTSDTAVSTEVQTDPQSTRERLATENAELIAKILSTTSRDLLSLFKGSNEAVQDAENDEEEDITHGTQSGRSKRQHGYSSEARGSQFQSVPDSGVSQSVFSQIAGHAHAHVQASLLNFAKEANLTQAAYVNERAKDLHDVLAAMIQGDETVLALAPVIVRYLAAPSDLETTVLCSVLRILRSIIIHSECFQEFLLLAASSSSPPTTNSSSTSHNRPSMQHPRISFSGLRYASLGEYLAAIKDDNVASREFLSAQTEEKQLSERMQMRSKLLSALCRVIQNNTINPRVVECGFNVLALWVDLGVAHRAPHTDFRALVSSNLIQEIVLAPKGVSIKHKTRALAVLLELVHYRETYSEIEVSARRTLFFNRCARILGGIVPTAHSVTTASRTAHEEAKRDVRALQHVVVGLFVTIVITYPSTGIRFMIESTHGHANEDDHDLSVVYYLTQLLHRETFDARTLGLDAVDEILHDQQRLSLIQTSFTLLTLLAPYVDLLRELGAPHQEYYFLSVLYLLSSSKFDVPKNNTISKTAAALITLVQSKQTHLAS